MGNIKATKTFSLPDYLHIPNYLYQDNRLEKAATYVAAFFCSLHHANKIIEVSTDYLCALADVKKRNIYKILNQLEDLKYISRSGSTNNRVVEWIYKTSAKITIVEPAQTSALQDTSLQTSALQDTKLVHSSAPNSCTGVHMYIKEDIKDNRERGASHSKDFSNPKVNPLENLKCIEAFAIKFANYDLTIEELFEDYSAKSTHGISSKGFLIWINRERLEEHQRKTKIDDPEFFRAGDLKRTPHQDALGKKNIESIRNMVLGAIKKTNKSKVYDLIETPKQRRIQYKRIEPKSFMKIQLPEQDIQ